MKSIFQALVNLAQQIWDSPRSVAMTTKRRQQTLLDEAEAERLDRIRTPSKYIGK